PGGSTAMARTVGLPMALAVDRILAGEIAVSGTHIPTDPEIFDPILDALAAEGITFDERWTEEHRSESPC
ncbi:MAG: saccharopine dehydrogenase C-terminal domain-containing protein, partial [Gemmatimonadota bacterium]